MFKHGPMAGKGTGPETADDPQGLEIQIPSWGIGEGFIDRVVSELDLEASIGGGSFLGREGHSRLKEQ